MRSLPIISAPPYIPRPLPPPPRPASRPPLSRPSVTFSPIPRVHLFHPDQPTRPSFPKYSVPSSPKSTPQPGLPPSALSSFNPSPQAHATSTSLPWPSFGNGLWRSPLPNKTFPPPRWTTTSSPSPVPHNPQGLVRFWRLSSSHIRSPAFPPPHFYPTIGKASPLSFALDPLPAGSGFSSTSSPLASSPTSPHPFSLRPTPPPSSHSLSFSESPKLNLSDSQTSAPTLSAFALPKGHPPTTGDQRHPSCKPGSPSFGTKLKPRAPVFPRYNSSSGPSTKPLHSRGTPFGEEELPCSSTSASTPPSSRHGDGGAHPRVPSRTLSSSVPSTPPPSSPSTIPHSSPPQSRFDPCGPPCSSRHTTTKPLSPALLPLLALPLHRPPLHPRQHLRCLQVASHILTTHFPLPRFESLHSTLQAAATQTLTPNPDLPLDSDSPTQRQSFRPPTAASLQAGLGLRGHVSVPVNVWRGLSLPSSLPPHPASPSPPTRPFDETFSFLRTLTDQTFVYPVSPQPGSPVFITYKTATQARCIADMRTYNHLWPTPPSFRLPSLGSLLPGHTFHNLYFTKIDLKNFFWSLVIPPFVDGSFVFTITSGDTSSSFATRSLPFGWSWSPIIAQRTMIHLLSGVCHMLPTVWIYLDDILLAHSDPHFLTYVTYLAVYLLQSAGFVISQKSILIPTSDITWLGKKLSPAGISNTLPRITQLLLSILSLRTDRCTFRALQRTLGSLQWLALPFSIAGPWLAPVYHFLLRSSASSPLLPLRTWSFLFTAFLFALLPATPHPTPPPCTMVPFFVDAAPNTGGGFTVSMFRPRSYATSISTPNWLSSQQDAELYSIFHALRQASLRKLPYVCIFCDNLAAFYSLLNGRVSCSHPVRARILRRIYRMCLSDCIHFQLVHIPSAFNPADPFSRPHTISKYHLSTLPFMMHPHYKLAPTVPPIWHHLP